MISINVNLTNSATSVKVMPEGALYWYGNECESVTGGWDNVGYTDYEKIYSVTSPTKNTNKLTYACVNNVMSIVGTNNKISLSQYSSIYFRGERTYGDYHPTLYVSEQKDNFGSPSNRLEILIINDSFSNNVIHTLNKNTPTANDAFFVAGVVTDSRTRNGNVYAIWLS